ncbi:hypothetical protein [Maridesulfovibrio sp.]|uniref:hypothetical protein n=1 Tax=Maridesulfovibrio sp. TaxID=2795000 RepID=UPI003BAA52B1
MAFQYIDLFDDELYFPEEYGVKGGVNEKLLHLENTIRLQIVMALLSGKQIVIPEQWMSSSATCLKIVSEVTRGYLKYRQNPENESSENQVSPPFIIGYLSDSGVGGMDHYVSCFLKRLKGNNRLCFSPKLSLEDNKENASTRSELINFFDTEKRYQFDSVGVRDELKDIIGNGKIAGYILDIVRYFNSFPENPKKSPRMYFYYDKSQYYAGIENKLRQVRAKCVPSATNDSYEKEIYEELELFFRTAKDKHNIPIGELLMLWWHSQKGGYTSQAKIFIENIGRNILHSSLAEQINCDYSSFFHGCINTKIEDEYLFKIDPVVKNSVALSWGDNNKKGDDFDIFARKFSRRLFEETDRNDVVRKEWSDNWQGIFETMDSKDFVSRYAEKRTKFIKDAEKYKNYFDDDISIKSMNSFYENLGKYVEPHGFFTKISSNGDSYWGVFNESHLKRNAIGALIPGVLGGGSGSVSRW